MKELTRFTRLYNELLAPENKLYAGQMLHRAFTLWPQQIALICQQETLTFEQLYHQASAVSFFLQENGILPGDRVMILYENSLPFYSAYHGAWQAGAVVVPVNTFMREKELEHVLNDAQPHVLIVSDKLHATATNLFDKIPLVIRQEQLNSLCSQSFTKNYTPRTLPHHELSVLLYTSGTTGLPKGVMLSSYNCVYNSIQGISVFDTQQGDRILCSLPLFHSFMQNGCIWSPCLLGAAIIIVPKIDRKTLFAAIAHKPTIVLGVPQLFGLFCMMKKIDFTSVRYFVCGGDALPNKIRKFFELTYGRKICNGYGLSETSPFISVDLEDTRSDTNTVGKPLIGINVQLKDNTHLVDTQPSNNHAHDKPIGVLWVKGENIMLGYYNAPEATAQIIDNGWLNTGDLARINSRGALVICGREKDLIVSKGINIYPQEIENCIMQHAAVEGVGAIGLKTEHNDEVPVAYVASREYADNPTPLQDELMRLCQQHLAAYKVPRHFIILKELPMTSTGKVDKKELRLMLAHKI